MAKMLSRLIRSTVALAGGGLAVFHGWIFASQAAAGRLDDPWLIFRWAAAIALIGALIAVRRGGDSLWGRKGVAIWVMAALLHGPAVAHKYEVADFAIPETVATSVLRLVASAAFAIGVWMLAGLLAARRASTRVRYSYRPAFALAGPLAGRSTPQFCPRPPPLRS
jgi:hypothetical protein